MRRSILAMSASAVLASGCGPEISLSGSIDETFSLEYDRHEIKKQGTALLIEYIKELSETAEEKPCRLVIETANLLIVPNSDLNRETFLQIVDVKRVSNPQQDFPDVEGGTVHFKDYEFVNGGLISGDFTTLFVNGRNLFGNFYAEVEEIEAP